MPFSVFDEYRTSELYDILEIIEASSTRDEINRILDKRANIQGEN